MHQRAIQKFQFSMLTSLYETNRFIEFDCDEKFMAMLSMYEDEKEVTIYTTTNNDIGSYNLCLCNHLCDNEDEPHDDSNYCPSEDNYYSHLNFDYEDETINDDDEEEYSFSKNSLSMKMSTNFGNVVDFIRSLNHYAITNEFNYFIQKSNPTRFIASCENMDCEWRIYASIMQGGITFEKIIEGHTFTRSNKGGNKRATQGKTLGGLPR